MGLSNTATILLPVNKYNNSTPSYVVNNASTYNGLMFCNTGVTISLSSKIYSYLTFDITFNGSAKYAAVSFGVLNKSTFSVGTSLNGIFTPFIDGIFDGFDFKLNNGEKKRIYVIINGDQNKIVNELQIRFAAGITSGTTPDPNNNFVIEYNCNVPLYSYTMDGLHVYSPYDAIYSSKLKTNLYSLTEINNWNSGTRVWLSPQFDTPAFPYYYGYGDYVYKVGGQFDRSYGTKEKYEVTQTLWRGIWGKPPIINKVVIGPSSYLNTIPDTTDACVNVIMVKSGIITEKINKNTLPKPSKYKYLMGYNPTNKQNSNDQYFTKYVFNESKFYPITGQQHAMYKLATGYINSVSYGIDSDGSIDPNFKIDPNGAIPMLIASGLPLGLTIASALLPSLNIFLQSIFIGGGPFGQWLITLLAGSSATGPLMPIVLLLLMVIGVIISLVKKTRKTFEENCKQFLHEYTVNPYIDKNYPLSRTKNMNNVNDGYYCDGIYFYTQSIGIVNNKELSSTNALLHENPISTGFQYSLPADDQLIVLAIDKLLMLPYLSGIPVEYNSNNVWYNTEISGSFPIVCFGDLMYSNSNNNIVTIPSGFTTSFISQADANSKALSYYNDAIAIIELNNNYCNVLDGDNLGTIDSYFTHDIKIENTPTTCTCYFNNTNGNGLEIGKKLYFDIQGRVLALNGFYAIDGDTEYRVFYKVVDGIVVDIYNMISSDSSTVTGIFDVLPVVLIDLDYSSNWYLHSGGLFDLTNKIDECKKQTIFDPNTLYIDSMMVKGFIKNDNSYFYLYEDNFSSLIYNEADSGWYVGLIEWLVNESFYYNKSQTIVLDIDEICLPSAQYNTGLFGFNVVAKNNGYITPAYNSVNLTTKVYKLVDDDTLLAATYNVITIPTQASTYFGYDNQILPTDNVNLIEISSINSINPQNRITYVIGGFNGCSAPTTTEYIPTTEYVPTTTEYVATTTEYVPTTTEYVATTTEYVPTTTEYVVTTTSYVPTTSEYIPALSIEFTGINWANQLVGDSTDVNNWNIFFDLPTNGNVFTSVLVVGNVVNLYGGSNIHLKNNLFYYNYRLISINDNINSIISAGEFCFDGTSIQNINLPSLVTAGDSCFKCGVYTINLPSLVTAGDRCFIGAYNLISPSFPSLVTAGGSCFQSCTNLTTPSFPVLETLGGDYCFYGTNLTNPSFPSLITASGTSFADCTNLTNPEFPVLETIGNYCFLNCINLTDVSFPSLITANNCSFYGCSGLTTPSFPSLIIAGDSAFYNCINLSEIDLPSIQTIENQCFRNCYSLTYINLHNLINLGSNVLYNTVFGGINNKNITLIVPSALMTCNSGNPDGDIQYLQANNNVTIITDVTTTSYVPTTTEYVPTTTGYVPTTTSYVPALSLTFDDNYYIGNLVSNFTDVNNWNTFFDLPTNGDVFTSVIVVNNVVNLYGGSNINLKDNLFEGNLFLINIQDNAGCVNSIGANSFYYCHNLVSVSLLSVVLIGNRSFNYCTNLNDINLPSLLTINTESFANCVNLTNISLPSLLSVANSGFFGCSSLTTIYSPLLEFIGSSGFYGTYLTEVNLPSLQTVGDYCFSECNNLTYINLPNLINLGSNVLYNNVFDGINNKNITLIVPSALMTCNSGNPDGDIEYLQANNNVTIITDVTTTSYVPTTTSYVPTTTEYVPTTTSYVPTTTEYVPTTTSYVPTTTEYVGSTTEFIPTTTVNTVNYPTIQIYTMLYTSCGYNEMPSYTQAMEACYRYNNCVFDNYEGFRLKAESWTIGKQLYDWAILPSQEGVPFIPINDGIPSGYYFGVTTGDNISYVFEFNDQGIITDVINGCSSITTTEYMTTTEYEPTTTSYVPSLSLSFDNISNVDQLVGDSSSVNDWNTFFDLPTNGDVFTSVLVVGNVVNLYGGSNINLVNQLFLNNQNIISIDDNINSIISAGFSCFYLSNSLTSINLPSLGTAGDDCFRSCVNLNSINLPSLVSAGVACFAMCSSLSNINLPSLTFIDIYGFRSCSLLSTIDLPVLNNLGGSVGDDNVFSLINGRTIELNIPSLLMTNNNNNPDGDIISLQANNTLTITYSDSPTTTLDTPTTTSLDEFGLCYNIKVPVTELDNGGVLYIEYYPYGSTFTSRPYTGYEDTSTDINYFEINLCSRAPIAFRRNGNQLNIQSAIITTGSYGCVSDNECVI